MTSPTTLSPEIQPVERNTLPQYGFGPEVNFEELIAGNPFLFRVHTPRAQPPQYDSSEPYFLGTKYQDAFSSAAISSPASPLSSKAASGSTYADVIQHMDWTSRPASPYISTSFSFAWAIYEAIRRYHVNVKHDVEIAVIDAKAVADRAVTAVQLLMKGSPKERHKDHWKFYRFALESQDVLVWGYIPGTAVLASIPLLQIISKLPSYFLYHDISDAKDSPLFKLAWDYTRRKPSYRQFCQVMSDRFLALPVDRRLRDTTAGSVRLAVALLRPYFHRHVAGDFSLVTSYVYELAYVIAQWPGQWWTREHPEIHELVRCIVHMLGEEMREARRLQALTDATKMQEIVGGLEQLAHAYEARSRQHKFDPSLPASPQPSPSPTLPPSPSPSETKFRIGPMDLDTSDMVQSITTETDSGASTLFSQPMEPREPPPAPAQAPAPVPVPIHRKRRSASGYEIVARTASCFVTGLLVGSFIALCVLSPDRRQLARHIS